MNPYETLGIARGASQDEIRAAYRKLAKKHHPDLNPGNKQAEQKFKDINQAYEWIGTPEARAKFDRGELGPDARPTGDGGSRRQGPFYYETQEGPGRYSQGFEGFDESIFESIFGARGGAGARGRAREGMAVPGEDQLFQLEIPLEDAVLGATRQLTLPDGKRIEVRIPPGVDTGAKLRFRGQGGAGFGNGAPAGDLYVELRVKPSERYRREGKDVHVELGVPLADAVLGGELEVPTLDGSVRMKVPPGVNSGSRLRVRGKGVRATEPAERGDVIVTLRVMLPGKPDPALREAIARWSGRAAPAAAGAEGKESAA